MTDDKMLRLQSFLGFPLLDVLQLKINLAHDGHQTVSHFPPAHDLINKN